MRKYEQMLGIAQKDPKASKHKKKKSAGRSDKVVFRAHLGPGETQESRAILRKCQVNTRPKTFLSNTFVFSWGIERRMDSS